MSELDIRNQNESTTDSIRFSDENNGTHKIRTIREGGVMQCNLHGAHEEHLCHVKYADIDNLILALKKAKQLWRNK